LGEASIDSQPDLTRETPEAGKVAIVTGAGGGIGAGVTAALSRQGMRIVAVDIDRSRIEAAAETLVAAGGDAIALVADARDEATASAAVETAFDHFRRIDVLVNLAGLMRNAMMQNVTDEDFTAVLESQVLGSLHFMKAVTPYLKRLGYGGIVNMSSIAARGHDRHGLVPGGQGRNRGDDKDRGARAGAARGDRQLRRPRRRQRRDVPDHPPRKFAHSSSSGSRLGGWRQPTMWRPPCASWPPLRRATSPARR
jgi:NAD(P)-dependent dehydrogenase (short-subunit alcohol dehydrogenase family)